MITREQVQKQFEDANDIMAAMDALLGAGAERQDAKDYAVATSAYNAAHKLLGEISDAFGATALMVNAALSHDAGIPASPAPLPLPPVISPSPPVTGPIIGDVGLPASGGGRFYAHELGPDDWVYYVQTPAAGGKVVVDGAANAAINSYQTGGTNYGYYLANFQRVRDTYAGKLR